VQLGKVQPCLGFKFRPVISQLFTNNILIKIVDENMVSKVSKVLDKFVEE